MRFGLINLYPNMNVTPGVTSQSVPTTLAPSNEKEVDAQNETTLTQSVFAKLDADKKNNVDYSEAKSSIFDNAESKLESALKAKAGNTNVKFDIAGKFQSLVSSFMVNFGEQTVSSTSKEDLNAKANELQGKLDSIVDAETQQLINSANDTITQMYTDALNEAKENERKENETLQLEENIASKFDPQPGSLEADGAVGTGTKKKYGTSFATKGTITIEEAAKKFGVSVAILEKFNPKAAEVGKFENGNDIYIPQSALKSANKTETTPKGTTAPTTEAPAQKAPPKIAITPIRPNAPSFEASLNTTAPINTTIKPISITQTTPIKSTAPKTAPKVTIKPLNSNGASFEESINTSTRSTSTQKAPVTPPITENDTKEITSDDATSETISTPKTENTSQTSEHTTNGPVKGTPRRSSIRELMGSYRIDINEKGNAEVQDYNHCFASSMNPIENHFGTESSPRIKHLATNHTIYMDLVNKQNNGTELSQPEQKFIEQHLKKLEDMHIKIDQKGNVIA